MSSGLGPAMGWTPCGSGTARAVAARRMMDDYVMGMPTHKGHATFGRHHLAAVDTAFGRHHLAAAVKAFGRHALTAAVKSCRHILAVAVEERQLEHG
jgi:hypothetical protein